MAEKVDEKFIMLLETLLEKAKVGKLTFRYSSYEIISQDISYDGFTVTKVPTNTAKVHLEFYEVDGE